MNWTKTPPTKPGAYWLKFTTDSKFNSLTKVEITSSGLAGVEAGGDPLLQLVDDFCGEWCGPLVPVEEVERAYREGFKIADLTEADYETCFANSRARHVMEGIEI